MWQYVLFSCGGKVDTVNTELCVSIPYLGHEGRSLLKYRLAQLLTWFRKLLRKAFTTCRFLHKLSQRLKMTCRTSGCGSQQSPWRTCHAGCCSGHSR